jgi:hypothetical protein
MQIQQERSKTMNNINILCEICDEQPPRTIESKYCQDCRDWLKGEEDYNE